MDGWMDGWMDAKMEGLINDGVLFNFLLYSCCVPLC